MKKLLYGWGVLCVSLLVAIGVSAVSGAVSVNSFRITSLDAQFELSRDADGVAVLKTTETITAVFPEENVNHGLERAIPNTYDDHSVALLVQSVTNENGTALKYGQTRSGDITLLRIGDAGSYVHGKQTYRIVYTQKGVTYVPDDAAKDEWYWDINGTEWRVPIDAYTATIRIDDALLPAQDGEPFCYQGPESSRQLCGITKSEDGSYVVRASNLKEQEAITVAFGFLKDTFAAYTGPDLSGLGRIMTRLLSIQGVIAGFIFPLVLGMVFLFERRHNRKGETNTFATEFTPPANASVSMAAQVVTTKGSLLAAQLIDLAVRHYIAIVETRPKSFLKSARYDLVIKKDVSSLREEEQEILKDMFGRTPGVEEKIALHDLKNNTSYALRLRNNERKFKKLAESGYGLRQKSSAAARPFLVLAIISTILAIPLLSPVIFGGAITFWVLYARMRPLTDKGVELARYLKGLERYVKLSEKDRLAFLQGPETAQKVGYTVNGTDAGQLVKLYERTLPYAILFGQEKEWGKRLGEIYEQAGASPDWYAGQTVVNAAVFASALSSISSAAAAASYSSSASSSSSSGSSGGGFSGGGGGGGGGGGW